MGKISAIPKSLRDSGLFCCWQYEVKNNRKTKIPYNPVSGQRAQTNKPSTFTDFHTALNAAQGYDGLGFLIAGGLFVIDCDHCKNEDGNLTQPAADIVGVFAGCYMEWSPSGEGLHIIGKVSDFAFDKKEYWMNNRRINVEVYISGSTNRFMTITGNVFHEGDIPEKSAELQTFLDRYMRRDVSAAPAPPVIDPVLSDAEVLSKAVNARNGAAFSRLWSGDTSGYASSSEADFALAGLLAFWCNRDVNQMDRLFRQSGLFREKWDRAQAGTTYGRITLEKAAADAKNVYKLPKKRKTAPSGNTSAMTSSDKPPAPGKGGICLHDLHPEDNPRYPWADIGSGRLFADYFKPIARYVKERKTWYVYDGKVWEPDTAGVEIQKLAKMLADDIIAYSTGIPDERLRTAYIDYCRKWQRLTFRETVVKEAQSEYPIRMEEYDADVYAFNCKNGTLHLDTLEFRPHDSGDSLTKISKVKYDPNISCERWEQFIGEILPDDPDTAAFLQTSLGYALTGETRFECLFILYGMTTRNGKGTLCESILRVMGDYGRSVKPETLAQKANMLGNSANEDIARLAGVRFANISEPDQRLTLNAPLVKSMTGNDRQPARFLYENTFEFYPQFKLYINTNHRPNISDMTLFTSNRIYIIPFERHFEKGEQDTTLKDEFQKPVNQTGILNWLVAGYKMLKERGLEPSKSVNAATDSYAHDSDKVTQFLEDCLTPDANGEERTQAVYDQYKIWCGRNGLRVESQKNFKQVLMKIAEVKRKRPRSGGSETTMLLGYTLPGGGYYEQSTLWG